MSGRGLGWGSIRIRGPYHLRSAREPRVVTIVELQEVWIVSPLDHESHALFCRVVDAPSADLWLGNGIKELDQFVEDSGSRAAPLQLPILHSRKTFACRFHQVGRLACFTPIRPELRQAFGKAQLKGVRPLLARNLQPAAVAVFGSLYVC